MVNTILNIISKVLEFLKKHDPIIRTATNWVLIPASLILLGVLLGTYL